MAAAVPSTALNSHLLLIPAGRSVPQPRLLALQSPARTAASDPSVLLRLPLSFNSTTPAKGVLLSEFHREQRRRRRPRRAFCSVKAAADHGRQSPQPPPRPFDLVRDFYSSVNDKDMNRLRELLSEDCCLEDLTFYKPFHGRKEVLRFLEKLSEAMGKNVRFVPENVYEGEASTAAAVVWHLEWNGERIPFTRGCSFFEFSADGGRLLIGKTLVLAESPVKPGEAVVDLLRVITSIFDKFPNLAEKFLKRPHAMIAFMMKIYKLFVEPLILPFLFYYIHLWSRFLQTIRALLNLLARIVKGIM